ncbi:acetoacetyl-synthase [Ilyonectria robusta]|uniref:acetoacetyl-synthase n=1 Tax=Ilyonectria robusta TaxID=1079257 RepID=UPI001E8DF987|nr:acetoacetyl-synthase [Ilyonectria robusta]KAH8721727.1 acetoacetyl-synthase [Ilyonectria robusta]
MASDIAAQPRLLWKPLSSSGMNLKRLIQTVNKKHGLSINDYKSLWEWSTSSATAPLFWMDLFDFLDIKSHGQPTCAFKTTGPPPVPMYPPPSFFPGVRMNFTENILAHHQPDDVVLHVVPEGGETSRDVTWRELHIEVSRLASAMVASGVKTGDRVAAVISNCQEAITCCLAALSLGAIWSSSSPDMGVEGVLSRLNQIRPKLVFCESEVVYNGKRRNLLPRHCAWAEVLNENTNLGQVIVIPRQDRLPSALGPKMISWDQFLSRDTGRTLGFAQLPFNHPAFIVYSSGTSGLPKCIVHSAGGLYMQVRKDSFLGYDVHPGDSILQYTTTGWVMWAMVLVSLSFGGRVVVYDGSPMFPDNLVLPRIVERLRVNVFGTSAKFLSLLMASGTKPKDQVDLSSLRTVTSTGSTLTAQVASWFYDEGFLPDIHLVSTCGGTDLACSLISGAAIMPLYAGEIQVQSLGMAVDLFEVDNEAGESIMNTGIAGELVCKQPFPSQPVGFWGDEVGEKYKNSYFSLYGDSIWNQGDFVSRNPITGGYVTHGRSDGVLNPAGVRFGSAEIYNVVEQDTQIGDSVCVGQRRLSDADESVVLFLKMAPGYKYNHAVVRRVREAIRSSLSPRHEPRFVFEVPDIPYTNNGKKIEILIKKIISGKMEKASPTVANPECLEFYKQFVNIEEAAAKQEQSWNKALL